MELLFPQIVSRKSEKSGRVPDFSLWGFVGELFDFDFY